MYGASAEDTLILSAVLHSFMSLGFDWQVHQSSRVVTVTLQKHISAVGPGCPSQHFHLTLQAHVNKTPYASNRHARLISLFELAAFCNTITLKRHFIYSFLSHTFSDGLRSGAALQQMYCWWFSCHCQQLTILQGDSELPFSLRRRSYRGNCS